MNFISLNVVGMDIALFVKSVKTLIKEVGMDKSSKLNNVAALGGSWKKIIKEMNKCVVLCTQCHSDVHKKNISVDESMLCKVDQNYYLCGPYLLGCRVTESTTDATVR